MTLIEKLVLGIKISRTEIEQELYYICDREHASCTEDCPVYRLNGGNAPGSDKPFEDNSGCDCFKNGKAMFEFIVEWWNNYIKDH